MLIPTLTLDGDLSVAAARVRLEGVPAESYVVVRRSAGMEVSWYRFSVRIVEMVIRQADPEAPLSTALNLSESGAADVFDIADLTDAEATGGYGVVLDGGRAVGVLEPAPSQATRGGGGGATRGAGAGGLESVAAPTAPAAPAPPIPSPAPPSPAAPAPAAPGPAAPGPAASGDDAAPGAGFSAFPHMESPAYAVVGQPIELVVKLAQEAQEGTNDVAIHVETELAEFDLVVQVIADGFTIGKVRDVLHVVRSDLDANEVRFTLTADPIEGPAAATKLEVEFSFGGVVCGRAWRSIAIIPSDAGAAAIPAPTGGASAVTVVEDPAAPDLEVSITENESGTALHWRFTSRHAIEIPDEAVHTRFREHNAKSFAQVQVRQADQSMGDAAIGNRMMGIARSIADEAPPQFWQVLERAWRAKKAEAAADGGDTIPTVLLSSSDTFIPWELASAEEDYVDPELADASLPPILGAQIRISRWMKAPLRGRSGKQNPPAPPPPAVVINKIALVIGDYLEASGQRKLEKAKEEGNALGALYPSIRLTASLEEIDPLFDGELVVDGEPVQPAVVHFACHGVVEPSNPLFNGIVLNAGFQRLDELYVRGNKLANPFVFLNACQLGTASELIADYGGMASAFLKTGCRGFVAPLWSVDDQLAHDTAIAFYEEAITEGVPVAEVMRRQRAKFDLKAAKPEATFLAYVYYGHPNLQMTTT